MHIRLLCFLYTYAAVASFSKAFLDEKFSGIDPEEIIFLMTLPDPETSVAATAAKKVESQKNEAVNGRLGYCYMSLNEASNVCLVDSSPSPVDFFQAKERSRCIHVSAFLHNQTSKYKNFQAI